MRKSEKLRESSITKSNKIRFKKIENPADISLSGTSNQSKIRYLKNKYLDIECRNKKRLD